MTISKAKDILTQEIKRAVEFNRRRDVTMRDQVLRNIEDLPLSAQYVAKALKAHGM